MRSGIGLVLAVFGCHQFIFRQNWRKLIPTDLAFLHGREAMTVLFVSGINISIGLFLISGYFLLAAAWLAFMWQVCTLPFAFNRNWQVGVNDLGLSFCLFALILLIS